LKRLAQVPSSHFIPPTCVGWGVSITQCKWLRLRQKHAPARAPSGRPGLGFAKSSCNPDRP
jgi:hypothetical protein